MAKEYKHKWYEKLKEHEHTSPTSIIINEQDGTRVVLDKASQRYIKLAHSHLIAVVKIQEKHRGTNLDPLDTVHRQL